MPLFGPPNIPKLKERRNVKALEAALSYERDATIGKQAARALAKLGAPGIVDRLERTESISALLLLFEYGGRELRVKAAQALGRLQAEEAAAAMVDKLDKFANEIKAGLVVALVEMGPAAVPALIEASSTSADAIEVLGRIADPRAVTPLQEILKGGSKRLRGSAAKALSKLDQVDSVDLVLKQLPASSGLDCMQIANALGDIGDPRAVDPLVAELGRESATELGNIMIALGRIGDPRAVEPLIKKLAHENRQVQRAAGKALAMLQDERAYEPLIEALQCGDEPTGYQRGAMQAKHAAAVALASIDAERAAPVVLEAVPTFVNHLNHTDSLVVISAREALISLSQIAAVRAYLEGEQADHPSEAVRRELEKALA